MKKLHFKLLAFIFAGMFLFSCELVDGEKIIKIETNPFADNVVRVHVAVLDGEDVLSQKVYEQEDVNEDGAIEIYTTPGADRTFVVVAEDDQGYASYYAHDTVDIDNDGKAVVELEMELAEWTREDAPIGERWIVYSSSTDILSWDSSGVAKTKYIIEYSDSETIKYQGFENSLYSIDETYNFTLEVEFYPFNLKTKEFAINIAV